MTRDMTHHADEKQGMTHKPNDKKETQMTHKKSDNSHQRYFEASSFKQLNSNIETRGIHRICFYFFQEFFSLQKWLN